MTAPSANPVPETTEEFSERLTAAIDNAALVLLMSIGHQTGLLDTLAASAGSTSEQLADAAGLEERYVREWLAGMTVAHVVDYEPVSAIYTLPSHRAATLTREAGLNNLARLAQYLPLLSEVEQKILGCFRRGGGLQYQDYPRFHAVMGERSREIFDKALIGTVLPLVEGFRKGWKVAWMLPISAAAVDMRSISWPRRFPPAGSRASISRTRRSQQRLQMPSGWGYVTRRS